MRQLDLFGSFVDTPEQEKKPADNKAVSKKGEGQRSSEAPSPAYSKNALRSERPSIAGAVVTDKTTATHLEKEEAVNIFTSQLSTTHAVVPSLFDAAPAHEEITSVLQEIEAAVSEITVEESIAEEEEIEQINVAEPLPSPIAEEPVSLTFEEKVDGPAKHFISEPIVEIKRKPIVPGQKQKAPELERTGSVIFDDGKITVKIKNTSPFPPPIEKEKKVRAKKPLQKRGRKSFKEIDAEVDLIEIPEDETLFQKQYYAISEVAKWFRVNTSLLRFWENEFDVLKPRKNRKGDRLFRPEDVKNLQLIYQLLRQRKYTIEGAKEYIKTNKKKADIQLQLTNTLQKFRSFLLDMKANLER